jgi:MFS family permease
VISLAADLTRGRGRFNTLAGLFATAVSVGGVLGPIMSGFVVQHMGFKAAFFLFAALACAGAFIFTALVPETKGNADWQRGTMERADQRAVA